MSLGEQRRPVVSRGIDAIDDELRLLVTVRRIIEKSGKNSSPLWFDQLLDERSQRLDQRAGARSRHQDVNTEAIDER